MIVDEVEFPVEEGKLREFARAVGGQAGVGSVPLTFVAVAGHWRDQGAMVEKLGLDIARVLVGGCEWEHRAAITVGDRLRGTRVLTGVEEKPAMRLFTLETRYERMSDGEIVVIQRDTVIELAPR
jgi:hypothetical protein